MQLVADHEGGASTKLLTRRYGLDQGTVVHELHDAVVVVRDQALPVERTEEAAQLYGEGWPQQRLAVRYGCDAKTVATTLERVLLATRVLGAATPGTDRLMDAVKAWWPTVEVLIVAGVSTGRTDAANTTVNRSSAPGAATATLPTTEPVSSSQEPPGRQREHPPQQPTPRSSTRSRSEQLQGSCPGR